MEPSYSKMEQPKRIFLWSNMRSMSTVFAKGLAHMDGVITWQHPYMANYFNSIFRNPTTFEKFPGMRTVLDEIKGSAASIDTVKDKYEGGNLRLQRDHPLTFEYIKEQLEKPLPEGKKFMFVKEHAFAIDGQYDKLPEGPSKHTFIIRHPNRLALSARKTIIRLYQYEGNPDEFDIGPGTNPLLEWDMLSKDPIYRLWNYVRENIEPNPVVIDADDLQNHTSDVMRKYCEAVGIPWKEKYLSWPASDEYTKYFYGAMEQVVWAKKVNMITSAIGSTHIRPGAGEIPTLPKCCEEFADEFREGYRVMYEHRIKPDRV